MLFRLILVLLVLQAPTPTQGRAGHRSQRNPLVSDQTLNSDPRGTEQSPPVVKFAPTAETKEETNREAQDRQDRSASDWWTVRLTGILAFIAFLQFLVYAYQAKKLRETVEAAGEQSADMKRHIQEATRSANAMENIVSVINFGNHAALRAYLSVIIGSALYQQREDDRQGIGDVKFEAKPTLVNTGNTVARNVVIRMKAQILPIPPPADFSWSVPEERNRTGSGLVGPHHQTILSAAVDDFVPDNEVGDIKRGTNKALCVWGTITYDDMFGGHHTTKFGQALTWWSDGTVYGYYLDGQNDAD